MHRHVLLLQAALTASIATVYSYVFDGSRGTNSFVVRRGTWSYRGHEVWYYEASHDAEGSYFDFAKQSRDSLPCDNGHPILLLNGFGVGSSHQERLINQLVNEGVTGKKIYCMDYIGQGRSWPNGKNDGIIYSAETWIDQIISFIDNVIHPKHGNGQVDLVGHSVGGYLAVALADRRPDLVQSLCLLGPTPLWGFNLPGWSGHLPAPPVVDSIGKFCLGAVCNKKAVRSCLESAYFSPQAINDDLVEEIITFASCPMAKDALASVMWSPPATANFYKTLSKVECDVLLIFGKNDPWCKPCFAKKMLRSLSLRKNGAVHRYLELENVGHCPNHEAPQAVGQALRSWVTERKRSLEALPLVNGTHQVIREPWADVIIRELHHDEIEESLIDRIATQLL